MELDRAYIEERETEERETKTDLEEISPQ